jgi:hypothetical protein
MHPFSETDVQGLYLKVQQPVSIVDLIMRASLQYLIIFLKELPL